MSWSHLQHWGHHVHKPQCNCSCHSHTYIYRKKSIPILVSSGKPKSFSIIFSPCNVWFPIITRTASHNGYNNAIYSFMLHTANLRTGIGIRTGKQDYAQNNRTDGCKIFHTVLFRDACSLSMRRINLKRPIPYFMSFILWTMSEVYRKKIWIAIKPAVQFGRNMI